MAIDILKVESYRKGIVYSSAFNVVAKVLAFGANLAVAFYFGTQEKTDVYFYAFATITLVTGFVSQLNAAVIVPESMRIAEQEGKDASMRFLNVFMYSYLALVIVVGLLFFFFPVDVYSRISRFDLNSLQHQVMILKATTPLFVLILMTTLLVDILTSLKYFTVPMLSSIISSIIVIVFVVVFHGVLDVLSIVAGLTVSYIVLLGLLVALMLRALDWDFRPRFVRLRRQVVSNIFYAQAGNAVSTMSSYAPMYLLSGFASGVITALNYGQRVADLPTALVTQQASSVSGIKFNELHAKRNLENMNEVFQKTLKILLFILVPISGLCFIYSREIIGILFKRGAFGGDSVETAGMFLQYLCLSLPMVAVNTFVARLNMAGQLIRQAFWYQVVLNIITIALIVEGVRLLGATGYPIGWVAVQTLNLFLLIFFMQRYHPAIRYRHILVVLGKTILLNVPVFSLVVGLNSILHTSSFVSLLTGASLYVGSLIGLTLLTGFNDEVNGYIRAFARSIGKVMQIRS